MIRTVTVQLLELSVGVIASPEGAKQSYKSEGGGLASNSQSQKKTASSLPLLAVTRMLPRAELLLRTGFSHKTGQALVFAIFLLALAGMLASAVAGIWGNALRLRSLETRSLSAFYLAQAGIEEAKIWARNNPGSNLTSGWIILGGGRYRYVVVGATRSLNSIGQALDTLGNVVAERQIAVQVNLSYTAQVNWSWQEI